MKSHIDGTLETVKFAEKRERYHESVEKILELDYETTDYLHYFPAFAGDLTLLRNFTLYEYYKKTLGLSGHIAEIGVYKGASSILFGKLINLFEPHSLTMVHGFDWFKGTEAVAENPLQVSGGNTEDENRLRELIRLQDLDNTIKIHKLDVTCELDEFFKNHPHLQFKMVFLDSGTYEVTSAAIKGFWNRLLPGGMLILDQFNNEVAPGETRAVRELLPNEQIHTLVGSWMPSSFIIRR